MTNPPGNPGRWTRVQNLFHAALEQAPARRAAFVAEACGTDADLRAEVESLLAAHDEEGLLGEPPGLDREPEAESFGPYRILRPLGHGGMGAVYLAERAGAGFRQVVALKLLRVGLGLPGRIPSDVQDRFARERLILARLEHPGIARLIDGGYTPEGHPFLAMEFVEGAALIEYSERQVRSVADRIELFIRVCEAVQFAHQRLVIHRDLKPANILVTEDGQPKLLDFGIATFAEREGQPEATTLTGLWFTPNYASPEQVRRERVTTLSDLYSLGVLLYELLAGVRPYEVGGLSPAPIEDVVCRLIPERPSARVPHPRRARELRGDLDTIVLKALAKEPERRYGSVQELADDLRRHLRREPVLARPDSLAYRTTSFLRRHRAAVAGGVLVAGALVAGLATTAWQAGVAARARDRAEAALAQSQRVTDFLIGLFQQSDPRRAALDPRSASAILERGVAQVDSLAEQPAVQARLLDALGMLFVNLARYDEAHDLISRALGIRLGLPEPEQQDVVESLRHLGQVRRATADYATAEALYRQALAIQRRHPPPDDLAIAETLMDLGFLMPYLVRAPEGEALYREALEIRRRRLGDGDPRVLSTMLNVAAMLRRKGDEAASVAMVEDVLRLVRESGIPGSRLEAQSWLQLGDLMNDRAGFLDSAAGCYERALAIQESYLGPDNLDLGHGLGGLAGVRQRQGRLRAAERLLRRSLAIHEHALPDGHVSIASTKEAVATVVAAQGRFNEALALRRESLATWRHAVGTEHPAYGGSLAGLGALLTEMGRYAEAEPMLLEAYRIRLAAGGPRHAWVANSLVALGQLYTRRGRYEEAERRLLGAWDIVRTFPEGHVEREAARVLLQALYERWGRPDDARRFRPGAPPQH
jgi:eukaryotic-like serine/threonine-protein kinase